MEIKQLPINEGVQLLGLWINPENKWDTQFKIIVNRMKLAMAKLE